MNIVDELLKIALLGSAWVLYLLLALSVGSLAVMAERAWFFRRNGRRGGEALRAALEQALRDDDLAEAERRLRASATLEGRAVAAALAFGAECQPAFANALEAELGRVRRDLERGSTFLGTIGNNAPFVGLFGTVIGVIVAFQELGSAAARAGAMGNVMSGIAEALVATGVGLFVAIPAVVAFNIVQKRINDVEQDTATLGRLVSAALELRDKRAREPGVRRPLAVASE